MEEIRRGNNTSYLFFFNNINTTLSLPTTEVPFQQHITTFTTTLPFHQQQQYLSIATTEVPFQQHITTFTTTPPFHQQQQYLSIATTEAPF